MSELIKIIVVMFFAYFLYSEAMQTVQSVKAKHQNAVIVHTAYLNNY